MNKVYDSWNVPERPVFVAEVFELKDFWEIRRHIVYGGKPDVRTRISKPELPDSPDWASITDGTFSVDDCVWHGTACGQVFRGAKRSPSERFLEEGRKAFFG